jgi:hypothetical protein
MVDWDSGVDLRCDECQEMGCECPKGYSFTTLACTACGNEFALVRPECAPGEPEDLPCPECSLHELEVTDRAGGGRHV